MLDSSDVHRVADRADNPRQALPAHRVGPESDADDPARSRDAASLLVGQVAYVVGHTAHPGVGGDHRPGCDGQDVVDRGGRRVGYVDDHSPRLCSLEQYSTRGGQAPPEPMGGAREFIVEEVREPEHPIAGVEEDLEVRELAIQGMGPLDGQ